MVEIWLLVEKSCMDTARISSVLYFVMLILCFQTQFDALLQSCKRNSSYIHNQLSNWIKIRIKFQTNKVFD